MTDSGEQASLDRSAFSRRATAHAAWERSSEMRLAAVIVSVTRELTRALPPPRGAPYFCLDSDAGYDLRVLDAFCGRGIFRKYEFALDIGSGLGGRARWLAARSGCRVVGIEPRPAAVAAAAMLNRRAQMDDQVTFQVGRLDSLPLRERVFTHIWMVDPEHGAARPDVLTEAFRVLRRGGHFALQVPMPSPPERETLLAVLHRIGFVDVEVVPVLCAEVSHACRVARARMDTALPQHGSEAARDDYHGFATGPERAQIFARRFT
jgi:SAM-dependent methyltransferase